MNAHTALTIESIIERRRQGEITVAQANVAMVRAERFRVISGRVPAEVRKALNDAVKSGELGRLPKDGFKPETYFHPEFEYLARGERASIECRAKSALAKVAGWE